MIRPQHALPRRSKLSNLVASDLGRSIVLGELEPDSHLPTEAQLGEIFGVSRSVIRDAVRMLLIRGLVDVRQGYGTVVTEPSDSAFAEALLLLLMRFEFTMGDVIEARAAIETQLAPLAALRGEESDWEFMETTLQEFASAVDKQQWEEARDAHFNFHIALLHAIHISVLEVFLKPIHQIILVSSTPPFNDSDLWEVHVHRKILAALRTRNESETRLAMENHFRYMEREPYVESRRAVFRDSPVVQAVLTNLLALDDS